MSENEEVARVSLDVRVRDDDFLERFAAYKNALNDVTKTKLRRRWTRKSMAESLLAAQCDVLRNQLTEMVAAFGELPPASDTEAVKRYAKRVAAWESETE